jgi:hypothetical protein
MGYTMNEKPYPHCKEDCRFIKNGSCDYRNQHVPTVAVDFDRVLFDHESWQGHNHVGKPIPGAKEVLESLQRKGFKIMIWTTRAQKDIIAQACTSSGIPFDYINENPNQPPEINPSKPVADFYIDDRALHFVSWDQVKLEIEHRQIHDGYYPQGEPGSGDPTGIVLKLCSCGNDSFRIIETADWLADLGIWEGNETIRICTRCGKTIGCFNDINGIGIDRNTLRKFERPDPVSSHCTGGISPAECFTKITQDRATERNLQEKTIHDLRETIARLYDAGFKNPMATFDAAIHELNQKAERGP